jgi:hypothetical protein
MCFPVETTTVSTGSDITKGVHTDNDVEARFEAWQIIALGARKGIMKKPQTMWLFWQLFTIEVFMLSLRMLRNSHDSLQYL